VNWFFDNIKLLEGMVGSVDSVDAILVQKGVPSTMVKGFKGKGGLEEKGW
jgi:hypothetical protein